MRCASGGRRASVEGQCLNGTSQNCGDVELEDPSPQSGTVSDPCYEWHFSERVERQCQLLVLHLDEVAGKDRANSPAG